MPSRRAQYVLAAVLGTALVTRIAPLARFGPFAYGYDSGFYRRYLIEPFISFPNTPVPGLDHTVFIPRIVLDVVRFLVHEPDIALYGTYVAFSLVGVWVFWYFAGKYLSPRGALYAALLYVISGVQFAAYGDFFFKEAVALPLFLFALLAFEREYYAWAAVLGVLIVLTQQTTAILLIGMAGLGFVFTIFTRREASIKYVFSGTAILASYLLLHPHVAQKVASPPVGIFLTQSEYLLLSLPLIALTVVGIRRSFALLRTQPVLAAALFVPLAFALFHLPFYNRVYAFLDLFLIIPAALGVEVLTVWFAAHVRRLLVPGLLAVFVIAAIPLLYLVHREAPLIDAGTEAALPSLASLPANAAIITSVPLLPWVQGWSLASVYAPGNLKEPHSGSDWTLYRSHENARFEHDFLASFPQPLYVFVEQAESSYRPDCATQVNDYLSDLSTCN